MATHITILLHSNVLTSAHFNPCAPGREGVRRTAQGIVVEGTSLEKSRQEPDVSHQLEGWKRG